MAKQLTGTVLRIWRAFGRVRLTVAWETGETATITVPKRQIEATIRAGDTVGTIVADPTYSAEDLMRWNAADRDPAAGPVPMADMTPDVPPHARHYHRVGGVPKR